MPDKEYNLVTYCEDTDDEVGSISLNEFPTGNASRLAGKIDELINDYEKDEDE